MCSFRGDLVSWTTYVFKEKGEENAKYGKCISTYSDKGKQKRAKSNIEWMVHDRLEENIDDTAYVIDKML
jgi:hypothetical protein